MLQSFRLWEKLFFRTLNTEELRSILFWGPDNRVSDPTDLAGNCCCISLQTLLASDGTPRSEPHALSKSRMSRCSVHGTIIDLQVEFSTGTLGLFRKPSFESEVLTGHSNFARENRAFSANCAALQMFLQCFWVAEPAVGAGGKNKA